MFKFLKTLLPLVILCYSIGCTALESYSVRNEPQDYHWISRVKHPLIHVPVSMEGYIAAQTTAQLFLLNSVDGSIVWNIPLRGSRGNHPSVNAGNYILAPDNKGRIYAIEKTTGKISWSNQLVLAGNETQRETIDDLKYFDGIVFVARHNSWLSAINLEDGKELWKATAFDRVPLFLEVHDDEVYLIGGNVINSINIDDGSTLWSKEIGGYVHATLKTGTTLFLGISYQPEDQVIAFDLNEKSIKWFSRLPNLDFNCLAIMDDFIYFSGNGVGKLNKDSGKMIWINESYQHLGCPVIIDDKIYTREMNGNLYIFDMNGDLIDSMILKRLSFWDNDWAENMIDMDNFLILYRDRYTLVALSPVH